MTYLYTYIVIYKIIKDFDIKENKYISILEINNLKNKYLKYYIYISRNIITKILFCKFIKKYNNIEKIIDIKNKLFIEKEIKKYKYLFDNICGYPLDNNQIRAIIIDDNKNLIVAGAGSGKSLTMIGKIRYLIETKNIKEEEILCISFTNEITKNLKNKLKKIYNYDIDVYTFHKLGYEIIKQNNNIKIAAKNILEDCIDEYFNLYTKEKIYMIFEYFNEFTKIPNNYKVKEKYNTLKSMCLNIEEKLKNKEEVILANIFYLKGISYKYKSTSYGCTFKLDNKKIYYYNFNNPLYTLKLLENSTHINIYKYNFIEKKF